MNLAEYNTSAVNNTSPVPDGAPENGTKVSDFNDIIRELMARLGRDKRDLNASLTSGGSNNAYTLNTHTQYADNNGVVVVFRANHTNTGAATLNVNGFGARQLRDGRNQTLEPGAIIGAIAYYAIFNGGTYQIQGISKHGDLAGGDLHAAATTAAAGFMSSADKAKLDGISAGAGQNLSAAQIKTQYESNANTNAFTDALMAKLDSLTVGGGSGYNTPAQVLAALLSVDGDAAGLNATTLQGNIPSAFVSALNGLTHLTGIQQGDDFLVYRDGIGHRRMRTSGLNPPIVTLTGSRALVANDANAILEYPTGGNITITCGNIFNPGTQTVFANHGTGVITIASAGVDLQSANGLRIIQPGGMAVLLRLNSNRFSLAGNLQ